ncbi:MAG: catechol 2,3-dioxygenase [Acidobacteriota bacterium]|nr:catechol 2,3-dioxygenase [Acidobacteriota bacterium]
MSPDATSNRQPGFGDVAHLGHIELLTPHFEESLTFFLNVIGLHASGRSGDSVYLRAWADYERFTLQLTRSHTSGLGHVAFRVRSASVLQQMVANLHAHQVAGEWRPAELGHGPAFRFFSPDRHAIELYYETERFHGTGELAPGYKNMPQRYIPSGIAPKRLDHLNLLAQDIRACRLFFRDLLGLRVTEQIVFDGNNEMGAWLAATNKSYDIAFTRDHSSAHGRFHHLTYMMDSREDVLRAADILTERGIAIETGPHKHSIGQTFFLYFYEPGGNRIEIGSGGYLILDPDWQPVVWSREERQRGQAWGLATVSTFHTYGTPPTED